MHGRVRSSSRCITADFEAGGWAAAFAAQIDAAVDELSDDRDVVSVAITPLLSRHFSDGGMLPKNTATSSVVITVVWRERP